MKKLYILMLTGIILAIAGVANAQITSATISGKIVDQKGAAMPGVSVYVTNTSTGTHYGAQTNIDGRYSIPNVNPGGPYTITASFIGFKKEERTDLTITLGNATYNFKMTDATTELKAVTVVGGATKNGAGTNVSQAQLRRVPAINRSLTDITRITPQSANNSFQGTNFRYNNLTLDGAINNDAIGFSPSLGGQTNQSGSVGSSTRTSPVSLDAIQDVQVLVAPYDIKIGNVLGGSINAVTRSGTNTVTGSVYGYGRGAFMVGPNNAPVLSGGDGGSEPSEFHDYNAGFRVGFPLIKDKLFFFTNEEISRRQDPVISGAGTAGSAAILSLQDAKDLATAFTAYTGGISPGTYDNTTIFSNSNKFFNRLDWNINDKNQLTLRNNTITSQATNLERDGANFRFSGIDYTSNNNSTSFVAELKSQISNNLHNNLVLGYSNVHDYRSPNSDPSLPQIEIAGRTPGTTIFMGTDREGAIFDMHQKTKEFTDNLTWTKGINNFTFGTHNEFYDITYNFVNAWNGRVAFGSIDKFTGVYNSNPATVTAFVPSRVRANYYYSDYQSNTRDNILANPSAQFNVNLWSAYAQDEIQATDNLKITAGIRLDYADIPTKQPLAAKTTSAAADPNYGTTFTYTKPADIKNNYLGNAQINPRVSFNYDINGDQSVILRGGTGSFTGRVPFAWFGYAFYNNGTTFGAYDKKTGFNPFLPSDLIHASPIGGLSFVNQQGQTTNSAGATQVDMIDNNFKMPQVWRSNLAVDFKTADQWRFTLEGIYTDVIRDLKFQQVNTTDQVAYYPYDTQHQQPIFVNTKPSANFTNAYELSNTNQGHRYSITAQVAKTIGGLDANVAYTYGESKDVTNGIRNSMESNWQLNQAANPNNPQEAFSNFDIRHRIVSTINYRLAWGATKSLVSNFTFFFSAQSGNPYTYGFYNTAIDGTGQQINVAYIPNAGETIKLFSTTPTTPSAAETAMAAAFDQYIDSNPYLSSRRGQFTERNAAHTPWNTDLDFRFTQDFNFGTKHKQVITITYDIINLTNLLNKDWGHYYFSSNTFNSTASIGLAPKVTPAFANIPTTYPTYTWTDPGVPYQVDLLTSRYQMQLGVRYSF
ncbi:TonB-dependent receptor [Mucilaginibacter sp. PPCGB 2223]|uniref:TonB-dependent receptor n=1 Tax=Mucilaginibacter sp. PPCGB 2223 TaxID=1886027 RepID=UPI0008271223|nr:TonB-dependent receptor [Mucilaginibacter sp. PPCGB 2223]OCX54594.1 TonB-dependent receptor [Mucilaginibacter sp. PPCGB 2223]